MKNRCFNYDGATDTRPRLSRLAAYAPCGLRSDEVDLRAVCILARKSVCSWLGGLRNLVSRHRSGVRNEYDCASALNAALAKLPFVFVCPCDAV